ncbi:hypothetical protein AUG19_04770 [archaeon 13_1_20CM_2_54_9]|nr:MAG: hypothetical protein AUG19_04770 [archaeon 13_1_20CM_2_54_9]
MLLGFFLVLLGTHEFQSQAEPTKVIIRAILVDKDLAQKPAPRLTITFTPWEGSADEPTGVKTGFDGSAETQLKPGKYRLTTPQGLDFQGHHYVWELELAISGPSYTVELSNDNAKVTDSAPSAPVRKIDELTTLFQKYQNSVFTVWSEIGHGTGFLIDPNGLVLTNQHVIGPSQLISVQFDGKRKVAARLLAFDPEKDVAVVWANMSAFPEAIVAPIATSEAGHEIAVEGERVFTIGSPLSRKKILTSGIVSKVEERAIISDININHGNSGGPLFNSLGTVVGLTTFKEEPTSVTGIVRIEQSFPVLEQARKKMKDVQQPEARLLPVEPMDSYPLDAIKEVLQAEKFNPKLYVFSAGDYDVAVTTPAYKYQAAEQGRIAAAKEKGKRTRNKDAAVQNTFEPLQDLRNWDEYAGEYKPVLLIRANPKLRETFWSSFGRGLASYGGNYPGPARMHFKTDFYRMKLLCGQKEIEPIQPFKIVRVENTHNYFVNVTDATYNGFYSYPADAVSPACGQVTLQLFSEKEPDRPTVKNLDAKTIEKIWSDFQPYFASHKAESGAATSKN